MSEACWISLKEKFNRRRPLGECFHATFGLLGN
jgi:hypothetical protein